MIVGESKVSHMSGTLMYMHPYWMNWKGMRNFAGLLRD